MGGGDKEVEKAEVPENSEETEKEHKEKPKRKLKKKTPKLDEEETQEEQKEPTPEVADDSNQEKTVHKKKLKKKAPKDADGESKEDPISTEQLVQASNESGQEQPSTPVIQSAKPVTGTPVGSSMANCSEIIFVDKLDGSYKCISCGNALRVPILFEDCGHRCCSSCLPNVLRGSSKCPADNTNLKKDHIKLDKEFQLQMDNLAVRCTFESNGCSWTGKLAQLGSHLSQCGYRVIACPNDCGVEFEHRFLETHITNDCPKRAKKCKFCDATLIAANELRHIGVCSKFPVTCPNGCKKREIPRCQLGEHLANECSKQDLACPFEQHGCQFRARKKKIDVHLTEAQLEHLTMVNSSMQQIALLLEAQTKSFTELKATLALQNKRLTALERCFGSSFTWKIDNYTEKYNMAKSGKQTTLFSPPFYTHRCGYRMAASVCLYGSGDCRGKFMSVFVCLCRGEHDSLLQWPFCHQLTFTLMDQNSDLSVRKPIEYTIKPNPVPDQSIYLGRPTGDRNACFGAPRFAKLETLKSSDYICEDSIFLKVTMNMDELPAM